MHTRHMACTHSVIPQTFPRQPILLRSEEQGLCSQQPAFKSQVCHLRAVWPWACAWTSLDLIFLSYKEQLIIPPPRLLWSLNELISVQCVELCLAGGALYVNICYYCLLSSYCLPGTVLLGAGDSAPDKWVLFLWNNHTQAQVWREGVGNSTKSKYLNTRQQSHNRILYSTYTALRRINIICSWFHCYN